MDVGLTRFETETKLITLMDAPGHKDFIPNMITGAAQVCSIIMATTIPNLRWSSAAFLQELLQALAKMLQTLSTKRVFFPKLCYFFHSTLYHCGCHDWSHDCDVLISAWLPLMKFFLVTFVDPLY